MNVVAEPPDPAELMDRYVQPFYLQIMRWNAVDSIDAQVDDLTRLGSTIVPGAVATLLRGNWRPRVMGAWFALFRPPEELREELL